MRRVLSIDRLDTFEQKKQLSPPRPKYPAPSTKNGRRSSRDVSKSVRFTTAGSTSTCPKSVHRRVQREVRGEQHASVQADAAIHGVRVVKRIAHRAGDVARAADHVGQHLGAPGRAVDDEPVQVPELRGAAGFIELPERPLRQLVETVLLTPDL